MGDLVENDHKLKVLSNKKTYYNIKKVVLSNAYLLEITVVKR